MTVVAAEGWTTTRRRAEVVSPRGQSIKRRDNGAGHAIRVWTPLWLYFYPSPSPSLTGPPSPPYKPATTREHAFNCRIIYTHDGFARTHCASPHSSPPSPQGHINLTIQFQDRVPSSLGSAQSFINANGPCKEFDRRPARRRPGGHATDGENGMVYIWIPFHTACTYTSASYSRIYFQSVKGGGGGVGFRLYFNYKTRLVGVLNTLNSSDFNKNL